MNEHDLKHLIEATLLAAGRPVSTAAAAGAVRRARAARRPSSCRPRSTCSLRDYAGARHRADRGRERLAHPGAPALRRCRVAPVAGASVALLARAARDAGADRVPPADHAQRDRGDPRRVDQLDDHAHAAGAQLDPRRRSPRGAGPSGAARHDARVPRLLRPAAASISCRRSPSCATSRRSACSSSCRAAKRRPRRWKSRRAIAKCAADDADVSVEAAPEDGEDNASPLARRVVRRRRAAHAHRPAGSVGRRSATGRGFAHP